eukprot:Hpha_TRINITY_DN22326_c0_g1::TRINITY_DN22326_c0_g1_i1::g.177605::m.177605
MIAHTAPPGANVVQWLSERQQAMASPLGDFAVKRAGPSEPAPSAPRPRGPVSLVSFKDPRDQATVYFARHVDGGAQLSCGVQALRFVEAVIAEDDAGPYIEAIPADGENGGNVRTVTLPDRLQVRALLDLFEAAGVRHNLMPSDSAASLPTSAPGRGVTNGGASPPRSPQRQGKVSPSPQKPKAKQQKPVQAVQEEEPQQAVKKEAASPPPVSQPSNGGRAPRPLFTEGQEVKVRRRVAFGESFVVAEPGDTGIVTQAPAGVGKVEVQVQRPDGDQWAVIDEDDLEPLRPTRGREKEERRGRERERSRSAGAQPEAARKSRADDWKASSYAKPLPEPEADLTEGQLKAREFEKRLHDQWLKGPYEKRRPGDQPPRGGRGRAEEKWHSDKWQEDRWHEDKWKEGGRRQEGRKGEDKWRQEGRKVEERRREEREWREEKQREKRREDESRRTQRNRRDEGKDRREGHEGGRDKPKRVAPKVEVVAVKEGARDRQAPGGEHRGGKGGRDTRPKAEGGRGGRRGEGGSPKEQDKGDSRRGGRGGRGGGRGGREERRPAGETAAPAPAA